MIGRRVCVAVVAVLSARVAAASEPGVTEGPTASQPARLPAVEVTSARKVRHDWYVGFGIGLGAGNLRPTTTEAGTGTGAAMVVLVRGGGRITDKLAVGGLAVSAFGSRSGGARGFASLMAEGLLFPVKGRGLALGLALGLSSAYGGRATTQADPVRSGVGFGLGVGYDFWLARRFNLGIWLRGDGSAGPKYGVRATGTLGLAFAWY